MPDPTALWGHGDLAAHFGFLPRASVPWPRAGRLKHPDPAEAEALRHFVDGPVQLVDVDPRELFANQPWVLREHAEYYLTGRWERTGRTSADRDQRANLFPVLVRDRLDRMVIHTGHHRSLVALILGRPVRARVLGGDTDPGDAVALTPHLLVGTTTPIPHEAISAPLDAVEHIRAGATVLTPTEEVAREALSVLLGGEPATTYSGSNPT